VDSQATTHLITQTCTAWNVVIDERPGKPRLKTNGSPQSRPVELKEGLSVRRLDLATDAGALSTSFVEVADGTVYEVRDLYLRAV